MVVWETGMGGRFDATNVVAPLVSVITGIGLDHLAHLGNTEAAIAGEKAGIIKPGTPVFCGKMSDEAMAVMVATAADRQAPLEQVLDACNVLADNARGVRRVAWRGTEFPLSLPGAVQLRSAALAAAVITHLAPKLGFDRERALSGFGKVRWAGRRQLLPDGAFLDGGHNPPAAAELANELGAIFPKERFTLVYGCLADKDAAEVLRPFVPLVTAARFVPVPGGGRATAEPATLAATWTRLGGASPTCTDLVSALSEPAANRRLIIGSLYLAGAVLAHYGMTDQVLNIY
jgi:dihydrofolate synthase/folylpolyglutamate synthase